MMKFRKIWDEEKNNWLMEHKTMDRNECYKLFIEVFNLSDVTFTAFCNQRSRIGACNYHAKHASTLSRPLYSEQRKKGYVRIKVAQPNVWKMKSRWVYEETHPGYEYSKDDKFLFLDGDRTNFSPANIEIIKSYEMTIFNNNGGVVIGNPELTRLNLLQARLRYQQLEAAEKVGLCAVYQTAHGKSRVMLADRVAYYENVEKPRRSTEEERSRRRKLMHERWLRIKENDPARYEAMKASHREWYRKNYKGKGKKANE